MYKIINGDTIGEMEKMVGYGTKVDKIITSPPYNTQRKNLDDRGYTGEYQDGMSNEAYREWTLDIFRAYDQVLNTNGCIMYNLSYSAENPTLMNLVVADVISQGLFELVDIITWKKSSVIPNSMSPNRMTRIVEFIYIFARKGETKTFTANKKVKSRRATGQANYENVYNFVEAKNNDGATKINKCTFSSDLVGQLMDRYVGENDIVLDNFNGTGTTGVECIKRGNMYYGIELQKEQCDHSIERLEGVANGN